MSTVTCPYCACPAVLVTGAQIYPHRPDLYGKRFWQCAPCDAYVGCHPPTRKHEAQPLGRLANAELRRAKMAAHAVFDPLWKAGAMSRSGAYGWLADALGLSRSECHIGMFDVEQCKAVVAAVRDRRA